MININTNISSMVATRILNYQDTQLNQSLQRLATGLRINTGKDDPAGLIASEGLRAEKRAIGAAMYNISRAQNVVSSAEGGLDEVSKLLLELEELVDKSSNEAGISDAERNANQLQIDAVLDSINRIATSNEFLGRKLLNGELDYTTSAVDSSDFTNVQIHSARIANDAYRTAVVEVVVSAQVATLTYAASATGAGTTTLEIIGNKGTENFSFASGTAIATMANAVNQSTSLTGVSASVVSATGLQFYSTEYGSDEFVTVQALEGTFTVTGGDAGATKDYGQDATVQVNGVRAVTDGLLARVRSTTLSVDLDLSATFGTTPGTSTFYITGGGADFMIAPTVSLNGMASLGIQAVSTGSLGKGSIGYLSSLGTGQTNSVDSGNFATAQEIIRASQTQVSELRGRLGAFQKDTLTPTSNSLAITLENITASEASIRDTDFAQETSNLTRNQILVQSAMSVLRIANAQPQSVLALLQ
ncbi:MAG: flagellin [Planctomycetes bacterium]|nr:flagellin [Planctomycetota bacterium]